MTVRVRKIPLEDMPEGIERSLRKSEQYLLDAEDLVSKNSLNNSLVFIGFSIEEFGRAVALRKKLEEGSKEVEEALFESHEYKYEKAWSVLPNELKIIYEGTFDPRIFDPRIFDAGKETISSRTRLDATFVDYVNGKWKEGVRANKEALMRVIKGIRESIEKFEYPNH